MKLTQQAFLKGRREFEIAGDIVTVRIKKLFREERLSVGLFTLDPEPVTSDSELTFFSREQQRPVLALLVNNPDADTFDSFVDVLKQQIQNTANAFAGMAAASPDSSRPAAPGWNVYEEPPEFQEFDEMQEEISVVPVSPEKLATDIGMLKTYLNEEDIKPLLDTLESLKAAPQNEAAFQEMVAAFNALGIQQGAILTYAPYLKVLLSKSFRL